MVQYSDMKKYPYFFFFVFIFIVAGFKVVSAQSNCTILNNNLGYGSTNSNSGSQVTMLQNFLYSNGYLSVAPTGRYGDMTISAVKKFQTTQGISAIGVVGPATRAAVQKVSCLVSTDQISTTNTTSANTSTTILCSNGNTLASNCAVAPGVISAAPVSVSKNYLISSPSTGTQLTIGQKYLIQWTGSAKQPIINVLLKDASGAGYVSGDLLGTANNYSWTVGNVSIVGQQTVMVPPGDYQLSVIDNASYGSVFNIKSGIFKIKEVPLYVNSVLPKQVYADGQTTVVLYGRGFNGLTRIKLNGIGYYNPVVVPQHVSPDGSFVWFYVPQSVDSGQYQVSVYNDYASLNDLATSTPSNSVNLQINQAVQ